MTCKSNGIVWCYSQWQPEYKEKKLCVCCIINLYCISLQEHPIKLWKKKMTVAMPHIEFKGIPTALEQDSYFDVNKWNLIVFDDQMIDASKDKRIVNLFTRGSHHRKLGVIYIVRAESIPSGER